MIGQLLIKQSGRIELGEQVMALVTKEDYEKDAFDDTWDELTGISS